MFEDVSVSLIKYELLPFLGPIMIDAGQKDYDNAVYAANAASMLVKSFESDIANYSSKVSQYTYNMNCMDSQITQLYGEIRRVDHDISDIKVQYDVISQIQVEMRSAVTLLGSLAKSANAAELETQHMIVLTALSKILDHVFTLSAKMLGQKFYDNREMKELISTLQLNQQKLQALASANRDKALDNYYDFLFL